VIELYQAEWCPHSRKVRQRLSELGVDFIARQVEAEPDDRKAMKDRTGENETPVLLVDDEVVAGEEKILKYLDENFDTRADADQHRAKALDKAGLPS
jgi:glutaredoxin 3